MSEAANAPEGQMIEGRYRITRRIAQGGMATVYEAQDERLGRTVAIKVMHTQLAQGPHRDQFIERFRREARSAARIANPHIVQVYDTGEFNGLAFLVMEYVHGVNLRHEMNRQGTFTVRETMRIVSETLDGLSSAHQIDVVHRDIKPENIMLNDRGRVLITDFGLAKATSQATLSTTGMLLGTAAYLPPETIERNEATPQGDLYAVGIMAWEMLAGEVPFISDNPVTLVFRHVHEDVPSLTVPCPGIDPSIARFIAHLTARSIDERPVDATAALAELRGVLRALPAEAWLYRKGDDERAGDASDDEAGAITVVGSRPTILPPTPPVPAPDGDPAATAPITDTADPAATQAMRPAAQTGPTRAMPVTAAETEDGNGMTTEGHVRAVSGDTPSPATARDPQPRTKAKPRRRGVVIAVAVLLATALAAGGAGAWWYYLGPGSYWALPAPADVACEDSRACTLEGASWKSYEGTLRTTGIPYKVTNEYSDDIAEGDIISARLGDAEAEVDAHVSKRHPSTLAVTVSKGVRMATIPTDILDPNSAAGKDPLGALKEAGFTNVTHDEAKDVYSMTLPEGTTLSISPDPGTTLKHNAEVTVSLSKGPMPVTMPDIVGRTRDEATTALDDLKLNAKWSEAYSDTIAAGQVISSSVAKDTQLHWGDSVDVVVSKGPEMVTVPDVRGKTYDEASKTLEALGLQVKKSAPLGDVTHTVRLQNPDPGKQVRVRDEKGNKTVVTLTVV